MDNKQYRVLTEISIVKFKQMLEDADEKPNPTEYIEEKYGQLRCKLFINILQAYKEKELDLAHFVRAALLDNGNVRYTLRSIRSKRVANGEKLASAKELRAS